MKQTKIQWCHSTINPVMGCDGCELWPGPEKVITELTKEIVIKYTIPPDTDLRTLIAEVVDDRELSEIYTDREAIAAELVARLKLEKAAIGVVVDLVREACKCYAGIIGTFRAGHKGYADEFTQPKLFPGRMAAAANWGPPTAAERATKPWLLDAPRMIFVSDMGDALSCIVSFPYLKQEIVDVVTSEKGRRHLWLWLTKRPARMAEFGRWLADQNIQWPDNLVAMTTITSQATAGRIAELRKVPSKFKGLSCEPIFTELNLDLTGIDWCIAGGGSDVLAETFHIEWALSLRGQCRKSGTAFFLKQLGKNPVFHGQPLKLKHRHGGNWDEWPVADWRTRDIPQGFRN
jgi:protein gp37